MFTGIITHQGEIKEVLKKDSYFFKVYCPYILPKLKEGTSVAHDGVCLTVLDKNEEEGTYFLQLIPETVERTKFSEVEVGDKVNIEMALTLSQPLDGHIVQGHVDGIAQVLKIHNIGDDWKIRFKPENGLIKYIAYKGSVAVNGVSLTVSGRGDDWFEISLIKHTLENTNLGSLKMMSKVNIEVDVIARYVESLNS